MNSELKKNNEWEYQERHIHIWVHGMLPILRNSFDSNDHITTATRKESQWFVVTASLIFWLLRYFSAYCSLSWRESLTRVCNFPLNFCFPGNGKSGKSKKFPGKFPGKFRKIEKGINHYFWGQKTWVFQLLSHQRSCLGIIDDFYQVLSTQKQSC